MQTHTGTQTLVRMDRGGRRKSGLCWLRGDSEAETELILKASRNGGPEPELLKNFLNLEESEWGEDAGGGRGGQGGG